VSFFLLVICLPPLDEAEKQAVSDTEDRRRQLLDGLRSTQSQDELRRSVLVKMRGVTNADETVCVSILESHSYDLKTSIEAYFQSPPPASRS
jgi:UBA-like domain